MDDVTFNKQLTEVFYQGRPCSYHYTKSLAEHLIGEQVARGYVPTYAAHSRPDSADSSDVEDNFEGISGRQVFTSTLGSDDDDDGPNCEVLDREEDEQSSKVGQTKEKVSGNVRGTSDETGSWRPFPAAIIRPSIITCAWKEPFPGWIDNYNGTTGFMVVSGKGVLRTIHCNPDYVTDVVPVDVVINACIAAGWYIAACRPKVGVTETVVEPEVEVVSSVVGSRRTSSSSSGVSSVSSSNSGGVFADKKGTGQEVFVVNCVSG